VVDADPDEGRTYPAESARAVATRAENVKVLTNMFEMLTRDNKNQMNIIANSQLYSSCSTQKDHIHQMIFPTSGYAAPQLKTYSFTVDNPIDPSHPRSIKCRIDIIPFPRISAYPIRLCCFIWDSLHKRYSPYFPEPVEWYDEEKQFFIISDSSL